MIELGGWGNYNCKKTC